MFKGFFSDESIECSLCNGKGFAYNAKCWGCNEKGKQNGENV